MDRFIFRLVVCGFMTLSVLSACTPRPTMAGPSAQEMQATIGASVALTLTAHAQTQAAIPSPTTIPSNTPTITPTPFPTLTPFPTSTPFVPGVGSVPPTSSVAYACSAANKSPFNNTVFKRNQDFDIRLWLVNIGNHKWEKGIDLLFDSGTNMLTTSIRYELPEVKPGETIGPFIFDAQAPRKVGTYTMTFKLQGGFCHPYIKIVVK